MKKALSLALALALCMGLFSGCGTEKPAPTAPASPRKAAGKLLRR